MKKIEVVAAILWQDNKFLLSKRRAGTNYAGFWEFPGGKLEPGETWQEALQRELLEELDLTIAQESLKFYHYSEFILAPKQILAIKFYLCKNYRQIAKAKEQQELGYFNIHEVCKLKFPPADIEVVTKLVADFKTRALIVF